MFFDNFADFLDRGSLHPAFDPVDIDQFLKLFLFNPGFGGNARGTPRAFDLQVPRVQTRWGPTMSFIETVRRARHLLREEGRIILRGLTREFDLDDDALEELVEELVDARQVAGRDGKRVQAADRDPRFSVRIRAGLPRMSESPGA